MPRLDVWLVEKGFFSSRQTAKRAIRDGLVTVNGIQAKPSKRISGQEEIIVSSEARDLPLGYFKLRQLDEQIDGGIIDSHTLALDIGSSAGGFLMYLEEKGATAIGVEISSEFIPRLQDYTKSSDKISLINGDAFTIDLDKICKSGTLDLLLIDVTTEVDGTVKLIERYSPLLKKNGKIIAAFKSRLDDEILASILSALSPDLYSNIETIVLDSYRQEFHLVAKRH